MVRINRIKLSIHIAILLLITMFILRYFNIDVLKEETIAKEVSINTENNIGYNLPLVIINTRGQKIGGETQISAEFALYNNTNGLNYLNDEPSLKNEISIKLRGSSSKGYPKKQYGFEFINENGEEKNIKLLDMSKDSDWILNGPFGDKSLIRNYMAYDITGNFMRYTPRVRFCEVFLLQNGEDTVGDNNYMGVYIIVEKIKRSDDRVAIRKTDKRREETSFIVVRDRVKSGDIFYRNYGAEVYLSDNKIINNYPKEPTEVQKIYIRNYISDFERVLYSERFKSKIEGYSKYIDEDTFVDYYIVNEFYKNTDAGIFSTFFYKDLGGELCAGPIWDFNASLGNYELGGIEYHDPTGFYMAQTPWFKRLLEDPAFVAKVKLRYKALRESYLSYDYLTNYIDERVKELNGAIERNFEKWPISLCNQEEFFRLNPLILDKFNGDIKLLDEYMKNNADKFKDTKRMAKSYEEEIKMLKEFIERRGKWIDENIDSLYKFTKE